jgi:hypothetical protein
MKPQLTSWCVDKSADRSADIPVDKNVRAPFPGHVAGAA